MCAMNQNKLNDKSGSKTTTLTKKPVLPKKKSLIGQNSGVTILMTGREGGERFSFSVLQTDTSNAQH